MTENWYIFFWQIEDLFIIIYAYGPNAQISISLFWLQFNCQSLESLTIPVNFVYCFAGLWVLEKGECCRITTTHQGTWFTGCLFFCELNYRCDSIDLICVLCNIFQGRGDSWKLGRTVERNGKSSLWVQKRPFFSLWTIWSLRGLLIIQWLHIRQGSRS